MKLKLKLQLSNGALKICFLVLVLDVFLQNLCRSFNFGLINRGVSFGVFSGIDKYLILVVLTLLVFGLLLYARKQVIPFFLLIVLGGMGNLISRFWYGSVWDYITLPFLPFWFNLSDVLITTGVVSYILWKYED